jgi:very-short-patch-repair endonuclease
MSHKMTQAEMTFWIYAQREWVKGIKCQKVFIYNKKIYIVDFCLMPHKVIIEIDGGYHQEDEQVIKDKERDKILEDHGYRVIRFSNHVVLTDPHYAIMKTKEILEKEVLL